MLYRRGSMRLAFAVSCLVKSGVVGASAEPPIEHVLDGNWSKLSDGPWESREGLVVSSVGDQMILTGGSVKSGGMFSGGDDVWRSTDGRNWSKAPAGDWGSRSYHIVVGPDASGCLFLMGGRTFIQFYNDVWKTCNAAETWTKVADNASWAGRAGLGGIMHNGKLIIAGGYLDAIAPAPGALRTNYEDVWMSEDGKNWTLQTDKPGWKGRGGGRLVSFNDQLFFIAGEIVELYFKTELKDVWSSQDDGKTWSLVQGSPAFTARSGHGVVTLPDYMVLLAGSPELTDIYYTNDGADWKRSAGLAWNCNSTKCGKSDFWPVVHKDELYLIGGCGTDMSFGKLYDETWSLDLKPSQLTGTPMWV